MDSAVLYTYKCQKQCFFTLNKLNNMKRTYLLLCYTAIFFLLTACRSETDKQLEAAFDLAGENRKELEKVLKHYKNEPDKLTAARFLIENMPGHGGYDPEIVKEMQNVYNQFENISIKYNWRHTPQWESEVKELSDKERKKLNPLKYHPKQDVEIIQANWLIKQIDMAFVAWKGNSYSQNCSFHEFCKYILPYRIKNRILLDQNREMFNREHSNHFQSNLLNFKEAVDSLLFQYKDLKHNAFFSNSIPLYDTKSFLQIKKGLCEEKGWFNWYLLSSLGMPVVIDFVPTWANRNQSHSWNAIVINGETFPFEPFWEANRWKYKTIYNNRTFDLNWGKFRLPKVFRHTYEYHIDGPLTDNKISPNDIPDLFKNPFMEDVSSEYFETTDIEINIPDIISRNDKYYYLCIYQLGNWIPVQWGIADANKKISFKKMGRDIVYLPAFYENKRIIPIGDPFYLDKYGKSKTLVCNSEKKDIFIRSYLPHIGFSPRRKYRKILKSTCITASANLSEKQDTICFLTDSIDVWLNQIDLPATKSYRYFQFHFPKDTLGLCEVIFHEKGKSERISDIKVIADLKDTKQQEKLISICDGISATGFKGPFKSNSNFRNTVIFDLGKERHISSLTYIPYTDSNLSDKDYFELQYLKNGSWESSGTKTGNYDHLTFKEVPTGTLYRVIRNSEPNRIFMYEDGIINWQ